MIRLLSTPLRAALAALGLLALGALAFVLVSGASESDSQGTGAAADPTQRPGESEEEAAARATVERLYALLRSERGGADATDLDADAFCELLSEDAREQTVDYVSESAGYEHDWDCPQAVSQLAVRTKRAGNFKGARKAKVVDVSTDGDEATAAVRISGQLASIPLVRESGEWRLAESPAN